MYSRENKWLMSIFCSFESWLQYNWNRQLKRGNTYPRTLSFNINLKEKKKRKIIYFWAEPFIPLYVAYVCSTAHSYHTLHEINTGSSMKTSKKIMGIYPIPPSSSRVRSSANCLPTFRGRPCSKYLLFLFAFKKIASAVNSLVGHRAVSRFFLRGGF